MRRPRNRRENRFNRTRSKHDYVKSANMIQNMARRYLEDRYRKLCKNYDDDNIFTMEPIYMIPRSLLIVLSGHGFNSCDMLKWICRPASVPSHPITREKLECSVQETCVDNILTFLSIEGKKILCKKGFHRNRKQYSKLLILYHKICMGKA